MRFVEDNKERLTRILGKPFARSVKDRPLDGAHEHVFEHRVVGDQQVRRRGLDFVPGEQFGVIRQGHGPEKIARLLILPPGPLRAEPGRNIGLGGPLAMLLQGIKQALRFPPLFRFFTLSPPLYVHIETIEGFEFHGIFLGCANTGIRRSACVSGKTRRTPGPLLEQFYEARIAEQRPEPSQLIIHQRIHGIENESPHCGSLPERARVHLRFAGKLA